MLCGKSSLQGCHSSACPTANNYIYTNDQNQPGTILVPWNQLAQHAEGPCSSKPSLSPKRCFSGKPPGLHQTRNCTHIVWENASWPGATTFLELNSMDKPALAPYRQSQWGHLLLAGSPFLLFSWCRGLGVAKSRYEAYQRKKDVFIFCLTCLTYVNTRKNGKQV